MKVTWIPKQVFESKFPTTLHILAFFKGHCRLASGLEKGDRDLVWAAAKSLGSWIGHDSREAPEPEERERQISQMENRPDWVASRNWYKGYFVNKPYVDFIRVEDSHQRRGIATALYQFAGMWLAERGMPLYASSIQDGSAIGVWDMMRRSKRFPTRKERFQDKVRTLLDYR